MELLPTNFTYGVKYLGSKKEILPHIWQVIQDLPIQSAIDVFCGTTRVAQYLRKRDIRMTTSDLSWASTAYALTYVHNGDNHHLQALIDQMNDLDPVQGWLTENYTGDQSPDAKVADGRCFQRKNTMQADAARDWLDQQCLLPWEKATLITSLIHALDEVDNTVGVQQAYLKAWCKRSYNDIQFKLPRCINGPIGEHIEGDCRKIAYTSHDLAYLDPPYSPHSYATYYHIWDSIVRWDKPATALKAKRRVDRVAKHQDYDPAMESPWNRPAAAQEAFTTLIASLPVRYVLVSYSDESLIERNVMQALCAEFGKVSLHEIPYVRNIMSQIGNAVKDGRTVESDQMNRELLILIDRASG